ncbi:MAG: type II toxin-antitoxin system VapC family toxin [Leptolyngbyaceae cyanobacterium]
MFADTGYWVALLSSNDDLHYKATYLSRTLQPVHILTNEVVLTEVLNAFSKRGVLLRDMAAQLITDLRSLKNVTIIAQTSQQFEQAFDLYKTEETRTGVKPTVHFLTLCKNLG